jgi:predicted NUDIX family NTP pyrophosphohydrolase
MELERPVPILSKLCLHRTLEVHSRSGDRHPHRACCATASLLLLGWAVLAGASRSSITPPQFADPSYYATGLGPVSIALGDLNGDRRPDAATADYREGVNKVSVLVNGGGGSFRRRRDYATGEEPFSVAMGDLDEDRKLDLAVANQFSDSVSVLINDGHGRFQPRRDHATGPSPLAVAIGDLDGDGRGDLATVNGLSHSLSVLLNAGGRHFDAKVDYRTGRRPEGIAIGDLTGDGKPELVTANRSDTVSVLVNKGDGTFRPRLDYRAGSGPRAVAIADLNADRSLDVTTANTNVGVYTHTVSVFLNKGGGTLGRRRDYRVDEGPVSIAAADVNGDSRPDLATANEVAGTISVLVNRGDGSFGVRRDFRTGRGPRGIAIADLSGDGRRDLATTDARSKISVLLNTTPRRG